MADRRLIDRRSQAVEASKARPAERRSARIARFEDAARRIDEAIPVWEGAHDASRLAGIAGPPFGRL